MLSKPCFKCGGSFQPLNNNMVGNNQPNQNQPRENNNRFQDKKRMRTDELDCDLDTLIQRDNNNGNQVGGNNQANKQP